MKLRLQILFTLGLLAGLSLFMFYTLLYYGEGYIGLELKSLGLLFVIGQPYGGSGRGAGATGGGGPMEPSSDRIPDREGQRGQVKQAPKPFTLTRGFVWCWFVSGLYCPRPRGCGECPYYPLPSLEKIKG